MFVLAFEKTTTTNICVFIIYNKEIVTLFSLICLATRFKSGWRLRLRASISFCCTRHHWMSSRNECNRADHWAPFDSSRERISSDFVRNKHQRLLISSSWVRNTSRSLVFFIDSSTSVDCADKLANASFWLSISFCSSFSNYYYYFLSSFKADLIVNYILYFYLIEFYDGLFGRVGIMIGS